MFFSIFFACFFKNETTPKCSMVSHSISFTHMDLFIQHLYRYHFCLSYSERIASKKLGTFIKFVQRISIWIVKGIWCFHLFVIIRIIYILVPFECFMQYNLFCDIDFFCWYEIKSKTNSVDGMECCNLLLRLENISIWLGFLF